MNRLLAVTAIILACVCVSSSANAQSPSNQLTMNQWVHLAEDGALTGRILLANASGQASVQSAMTVLVRDDAGNTHQRQTDSEGQFSFDGLKPGIYSLVAKGQGAFATAALHVLPTSEGAGDGFPSTAEISAAKIHDKTVQMAIARYLPPNLERDLAPFATVNLDKLASHIFGSELSQVVQVDGGMKGNIFKAGAAGSELRTSGRTNVFLFQNGLEVARGLTDERGRFEIDTLEVGHYSLLAIGRDGIGSIGFVLVDNEEAAKTNRLKSSGTNAETLVMQYGCCGVQDEFAMQIAPVPDAIEMVQAPFQDSCGCGAPVPVPACGCAVPVDPCGCGEIIQGEVVAEPIAEAEGSLGDGYAGYSSGGGFGGGFGGGGGGGGFGLGGLGALGALGGVLAASGNNGGGGVITAPITAPIAQSPFAPPGN